MNSRPTQFINEVFEISTISDPIYGEIVFCNKNDLKINRLINIRDMKYIENTTTISTRKKFSDIVKQYGDILKSEGVFSKVRKIPAKNEIQINFVADSRIRKEILYNICVAKKRINPINRCPFIERLTDTYYYHGKYVISNRMPIIQYYSYPKIDNSEIEFYLKNKYRIQLYNLISCQPRNIDKTVIEEILDIENINHDFLNNTNYFINGAIYILLTTEKNLDYSKPRSQLIAMGYSLMNKNIYGNDNWLDLYNKLKSMNKESFLKLKKDIEKKYSCKFDFRKSKKLCEFTYKALSHI